MESVRDEGIEQQGANVGEKQQYYDDHEKDDNEDEYPSNIDDDE